MPQEHHHHPSAPLVVAASLAMIAGFVDAHIYMNVAPVFVANMSGNLVHLGMLSGLEDWSGASASAATLVAFTAGVVIATWHHDRYVRSGRRLRPDFLLWVEAALLVGVVAILMQFDIGFTARPIARDYPVFLIGGIAMGLQSAALRRVGSVAVATTYGTGAIVRVGEKIILGARSAARVGDTKRRVTVAVLLSVILCYVFGAALAARIGHGPAWLLIPAGGLAAIAVSTHLGSMQPEREG